MTDTKALDYEKFLWDSLEMDSLESDMISSNYSPNGELMMGTGRTINACNQCSNSNTTSGCGGC